MILYQGMNYTDQEKREHYSYLKSLLTNKYILQMIGNTHHKHSNTFLHSKLIALECLYIAHKSKKCYNVKSLLLGAMLHDFFLYNQKEKKTHLHLFYHPSEAYENARKYFDVNEIVKDIILHHMWPLALTKPPKFKEAWLVCYVDKKASIKERIMNKKYLQKMKEKENYYEKI